jgi:hypothetical protein
VEFPDIPEYCKQEDVLLLFPSPVVIHSIHHQLGVKVYFGIGFIEGQKISGDRQHLATNKTNSAA